MRLMRHNALMLQGDDRQTIVRSIQILFQLTLSLTPCQRQSCLTSWGIPRTRSILQRRHAFAQRRDSHFQKASPCTGLLRWLPVLAPMRRSQLTDVMPG